MRWTSYIAFLSAILLSAAALAAGLPARKPTVVLVIADQWRAQAFGFAGDPNARTPHLDRLAAEGVTLNTAVSTCPVCSPCRASILTGRYATTHGVFLNDVCLSNDAVSLAQAFKGAGYQTAFVGKWHLDGHGRTSFIPPERRQGFEFWRACECTHNYFQSVYYADTPEKQYWKGYDAVAQTDAAREYIKDNRERPFLLVLSFGPPHNPYETAPEPFRGQFKPAEIRLRPNVPPESQAAARRDLADYYAHCAALDECVGRLDQALHELGQADDTILVFTSDHGDMLGSHAEERKQRPWDESIRVPFLVRWPAGLKPAARKLTAPLATPEIMPTLLSLCGIPIPATVEGEDRSAWLRGEQPDSDAAGSDRAALICCISPFGEWTRAKGGREYRGLRTARYTYVRTLAGSWLLYDNQTDPYQQRNLIGVDKSAALAANLDARLSEELKRRHDEFLPGQEYIHRWGYQTDASGTVPITQ